MTRDEWILASDEVLRRSCAEDFYRASGPGGQKRNKTESAVRLRHEATGMIVVAVESRSREENRVRALRRLREAIAYKVRQEPAEGELASVLKEAAQAELRVGRRDERYLPVAAHLLDLLESHGGRLSEVAESLSLPTAKVVRFLETTPELWEAIQQIRDRHALPHLKRKE